MTVPAGVMKVKNMKAYSLAIVAVGLMTLGVSGTSADVAAQSAQWNGTILLTRTATATYNIGTAGDTEKHVDHLSETVSITIKNGKAEATIDYLLEEHLDGLRENEISKDTTVVDHVTKGTGTTKNVSFDVQFVDDGTYTLSFNAGGITGTIDSISIVNIQCKIQDFGCRSGVQKSNTSDKVNDLSGGAGEVTKAIGGTPNVLSGTANQAFDFAGAPQQGTIKWSLRR